MEEKTFVEQMRDRLFAVEKRINRLNRISRRDRYASEYPYHDQETGRTRLCQTFAYATKQKREAFAKPLLTALFQRGIQGVEIIKRTEDWAKTRHPHSIEIRIGGAGINTREDAYTRMVDLFEAAGKTLPTRREKPWEKYVAAYKVKNTMTFRDGALNQIRNIDALSGFYGDLDIYVVGTHTSKSISLPVVELTLPYSATRITLRDNFHDICVSVDAHFPVGNKALLETLFATDKTDGYFEGFPKGRVFKPYDADQKRFSFTVGGYPTLLSVLSELYRQDGKDMERRFQAAPRPAAA